MRPTHLVVLASCSVLAISCGNDSGPVSGPSGPIETGSIETQAGGESHWLHVEGAMQKGPFLLGSTIRISVLDTQASPTGANYSTQTSNDLGEFVVDLKLDEARTPVALEGTGFYYNEVSGQLSNANLTMRAMAELVVGPDTKQQVFLNVITHLAHTRLKMLMARMLRGGVLSFEEARTQAEREVIDLFGLPADGLELSAATEMNILGGQTDSNTFLFAASAILMQAAVSRDGGAGRVDARLQELLNAIALELVEGEGKVGPAIAAEIAQAQLDLNPEDVMDKLRKRLASLGSDAVVPDLNTILDSDGDGALNLLDACPFDAGVDNTDSDGDGIGDGCDCGNGVLNERQGEQCDDGNQVDDDECTNDCRLRWCNLDDALCTRDEDCAHDHVCRKPAGGDRGCCAPVGNCTELANACKVGFDAYAYEGEPCDAHRVQCRPEGRPVGPGLTLCQPAEGRCETGFVCVDQWCEPDLSCGNGTVDLDEECDDGNKIDGDGCNIDCTVTQCMGAQPRRSAPMAYDLAHDSLVLFSARDPVESADTWVWTDGGKWTEVCGDDDCGPAQRVGARMVYDDARGVVVMFGRAFTDVDSATWEWDGTQWRKACDGQGTCPGPAPRAIPAMAYDSKRKSVLLFGGYSTEHTWLTDLWRWKDGAWTQLCGEGTDCAAPDATFGETAGLAYDSRRDRLVLFGGYKTWEWDGGAWSLVHDTGKPGDDGFAAPPVYRYLTAAMAFDSAAGVTLLFSASDARLTRYDELWAWDGVSWQVICGGDTGCNGPEDRYGASITYDSRNQRLLMYGGVTSSSDQELWQWKDGAWALLCGQ